MELAALEDHLSLGILAFERSPMGAMLDAIENRSYVSVPCARCLTAGILSDGRWCDLCGGPGWRMARRSKTEGTGCLDARPNHSLHASHKKSPEPEQVSAYAVMSRRLSRLPEINELVIRACFGDWGAKWAESSAGRSWAATPFTSSGAKLLRTDLATTGKRERPLERMTELAQLDKSAPELQRGKLLSQAVKQAVVLLRESVGCWNLQCLIEMGGLADVG